MIIYNTKIKGSNVREVYEQYGEDVFSRRGIEKATGTQTAPTLWVYLRAIGRALGKPCGAAEAKAKMWRWDDSQLTRLDARPAYEMFKAGLSIGQAVAVYRAAMVDAVLWDRGYGSPSSPKAMVIWEGLRRKWTTREILLVARAYPSGFLPKDALKAAKMRLSIQGGFWRILQRGMPKRLERLAYRALSRMEPGVRSYCAVLGAAVTEERVGGRNGAGFWEVLRELLSWKTSALVAEWGSPKMRWGVLGVAVDPKATVSPLPGTSGTAAKELAAMAVREYWDGSRIGDDLLRPMANMLAAFGKKAADMVPVLGGRGHEYTEGLRFYGSTHDAGQFTPSSDPAVARAAGDYILGHRKALKDRFVQDREAAQQEAKLILSNFTPEMAKLGWREAVKACRANEYGPDVPPAVATVCSEVNVSKEMAIQFVSWLNSHPAKKESRLPDARVTGAEVGLEGDWEFRKLSDGDLRGPILGLYTDCCQHPGGAGASCAAHGWTSPNGGFYVVLHGGRIVAQSWAWRADRVVVMDNVEALRGHQDGALALYRAAAEKMLRADETLDAIHVGEGYDDAGVRDLPIAVAVNPKDYSGYRDSHLQRLLMARASLPEARRSDAISLSDLLAIEREAYPAHMQELQSCQRWAEVADYACPDNWQLVVLGKPRRWYAILAVCGSMAEAVDIAKVPGTATVPWRTLASEIRRRGIHRIRLDARKATSWRVIRGLAPKLGFRIESESTWKWEEDEMVQMTIVVQ